MAKDEMEDFELDDLGDIGDLDDFDIGDDSFDLDDTDLDQNASDTSSSSLESENSDLSMDMDESALDDLDLGPSLGESNDSIENDMDLSELEGDLAVEDTLSDDSDILDDSSMDLDELDDDILDETQSEGKGDTTEIEDDILMDADMETSGESDLALDDELGDINMDDVDSSDIGSEDLALDDSAIMEDDDELELEEMDANMPDETVQDSLSMSEEDDANLSIMDDVTSESEVVEDLPLDDAPADLDLSLEEPMEEASELSLDETIENDDMDLSLDDASEEDAIDLSLDDALEDEPVDLSLDDTLEETTDSPDITEMIVDEGIESEQSAIPDDLDLESPITLDEPEDLSVEMSGNDSVIQETHVSSTQVVTSTSQIEVEEPEEHVTPINSKERLVSKDALLNLPHQLNVEVGKATLKGDDITSLTYGSVIELDKKINEPVDIVLGDNTIAQGEIVQINEEQLGVRITRINF